jgi:predicted AlkP superfamily phosphohydrolase/phosphomutase
MISGYPCPDAERNFTYPPEWSQRLSRRYNFSADHYLGASDEEVIEDGLNMMRRRTDLALSLVSDGAIDVCVMVLGAIDRAQHDLFKYAAPRFSAHGPASRDLRQAINRHYEVADEQVGRLLETLAPGGVALVISDHGGGPHPPRYFHTNAWLRTHGWLAVKGGTTGSRRGILRRGIHTLRQWMPFEESLRRLLPDVIVNRVRRHTLNITDVDWTHTRAYRFPMYYPAEGIEINLRGRQPQGTVEPGAEYEQRVDDIVQALRDARDPETGEPIAREVYCRDEIYRGPYLDIAPDVVFVCHPSHRSDVELRGQFTGPVDLDALRKYNGVHTMDGILFAYGEGITRGKEISGARLVDIAPSVLYLTGLPVPRDMDGRVLTEILTEERSTVPVEYVDAEDWGSEQAHLTAEDEAAILEKLRGLGYVD